MFPVVDAGQYTTAGHFGPTLSYDIVAMLSAEDERVQLLKPVVTLVRTTPVCA